MTKNLGTSTFLITFYEQISKLICLILAKLVCISFLKLFKLFRNCLKITRLAQTCLVLLRIKQNCLKVYVNIKVGYKELVTT